MEVREARRRDLEEELTEVLHEARVGIVDHNGWRAGARVQGVCARAAQRGERREPVVVWRDITVMNPF